MTWEDWDELSEGPGAVYLGKELQGELADLIDHDGAARIPDDKERAQAVEALRKGGFCIVLGQKVY